MLEIAPRRHRYNAGETGAQAQEIRRAFRRKATLVRVGPICISDCGACRIDSLKRARGDPAVDIHPYFTQTPPLSLRRIPVFA